MSAAPTEIAPPLLRNGDVMDRHEFERRWNEMLNLKRAQLIKGVVHIMSPVGNRHAVAHSILGGWGFVWALATPGVQSQIAPSTILDDDNEPQPDFSLRIESPVHGRTQIANDRTVGGPELVAEIAVTTVATDMNDKRDIYQQHGIPEYIIWRVEDQEIDWFVLRDNGYERLTPDANGILKSEVFPGLWLDPAAMIAGNAAQVHSVLQHGIATTEHADFVTRLQTP